MARMLPPTIAEGTESRAERALFIRLRDELSDDWTVMHSVGSTLHGSKPWAEIDFVLIGPSGIFCLEVKGGRLAREAGEWLFIDGRDRVSRKREGPFEQVGPASTQLRNYLVEKAPELRHSIVGYGVVTPDFTFRIDGPDIEPAVVYDERDASNPFGTYLDRIERYWRERLGRSNPLSPALRGRAAALIRPDFDLRPSIRSSLHAVNRELLRLTTEQYHVLDGLIDNERMIVRGGAGTGKTLLAVEEAKRLAQRGHRVLLCCFNQLLAEHLRRLPELDGVDVYHFHGLLARLIADAGLRNRLPDATPDQLFRVFMPQVALEALLDGDSGSVYDSVIVDEAQDLLLDDYVDVLDALLRGGWANGTWRLFLDPHQNLFRSSNPAALGRLLSMQPTQYRLSVNCRNTEPVATTAAMIGGIDSTEVLSADGPDVEWIWYEDDAAQRRLVGRRLSRLLSEGVDRADIVVLSRRRLANSGLREVLEGCPVRLQEIGSSDGSGIRYATIGSFKGLEADIVIVADVEDLSPVEARMDYYVGASRARGLLVMALRKNLDENYRQMARAFGERLARCGSGGRHLT